MKCRVEDIAKRNTFGVSTLLYKHFFGTLETTNMKKEILLAFLHDPVSPMVYHFHKQRVKRAKVTLNRSESFPFHDSLPKWKGRLYCGNETQKLVQYESTKTFYEHVMPPLTKGRVNGNFNINEAEIVRDVSFSSGYAKGQKHKEIKHVNMNLKQKIEHVTGESEKEKIRVAMDSVIHKLPQGQGISDELKKEILKKLTDPIIKREVQYKNCIRRIKSLEEPLESYFKQKENSFRIEDIHLQYEKLKLVKEKSHSSPLRMLIPLERILSLPDLQSFSYASPLSFNDQDIMAIKEYKASIAASDSKSKARSSDRPNNVDEQQVTKKDSLKVIKTTKNAHKLEIQTKKFNHEIPHIHVDTKDKDEFNYVKYVLEISGLTSNESLSSWHAKDTPLDPSLYEEMENDPEFCSHKGGQCNHHVLFDLINETMLEIYGRSHCCPPIGCHILHKVWTHMSKSLGLRYKVDQTIDDHVGRDFSSKSDGWVNHHIYDECVGLEIEDMIFHDLLEEIMLDLACL
uniref:Protein TRM32-like n=2 Tax=Cicer arietinum TaxID=3827 RepID=A0A3Q7XII9_CICAR|nr:protein TRM32-like [Cicer arietinum]